MAANEPARGTAPAGGRRRRAGTASATPRRAGRKRIGGGELIQQLNDMIAELIRENRKLKRQVDRLTARGSAAASSTVERGLRTIQRRVQRALTSTTTSKRRATKVRPPKTTRRRANKPRE